MERLVLLLLLVPCFLSSVVHGDLAAQDNSNTGVLAFKDFPGAYADTFYLANPCQWKWVECSSDNPSRVISIDLSARAIWGKVPDFSSLDALQSINFANNQFFGPIPDFIGTLPDLRNLDLSNNDFSGVVPKSLSGNSAIKTDFSGNPRLCLSEPCKQSPRTSNQGKKKKAVGLAISPFFVIWTVAGVYLMMKHKERVQAAIQGRLQGSNTQINGVMMDQNDQPHTERDYVPLRP